MRPHRLLVLLSLLLLACGQTPFGGIGGTRGAEGTHWTLIFLNGKAPLESHPITLHLTSTEMGGNAGCNHYGGKYEVDGNSLRFPYSIFSTAVGCNPDDVMNQEAEFLRTLRRADRYRIAGDRLETIDAQGQSILVFEKAP